MMRSRSLRWLILYTAVVLLLPSCSDSADDSADTTLATTSDKESLIMVVFGDSVVWDGTLNDAYAASLEEVFGAPVNVRSYSAP